MYVSRSVPAAGGNFRGYEQNLCFQIPLLTGHKCDGTNMATESGARYRDNQNASHITDVKKKKEIVG